MSIETNITSMRAQVMQTTETQHVPKNVGRSESDPAGKTSSEMDRINISKEALSASRAVNGANRTENTYEGIESKSVLEAVKNSVAVLAEVAAKVDSDFTIGG